MSLLVGLSVLTGISKEKKKGGGARNLEIILSSGDFMHSSKTSELQQAGRGEEGALLSRIWHLCAGCLELACIFISSLIKMQTGA